MRASRLFVATFLVPVAALFAYVMALGWNQDGSFIDANGAAVGLILIVGSVFGVSKVAADEQWSERAGTSLALATAYFALTWVRYGDSSLSVDSQPHIVWFGLCIAAFMPAVVIIPTSKWVWSWMRGRHDSRSVAA